jgi:hypothetical protein
MPNKALAKLLAALISASRSAYVTAARISGQGGPRKALANYLLNSKMLAPNPTSSLLKMKGDDFYKALLEAAKSGAWKKTP